MKFVHKETKAKFETDNKNLFSMLEREGFVMVKGKTTPDEEKQEEKKEE